MLGDTSLHRNISIAVSGGQSAIMPRRMKSFAAPLIILLLAFALRTAPLTQNRLHPDEAWYGHFALRITSGRDPWLHEVIVDKPPLPFYLAAGSIALMAPSPRENAIAAEFAARLPSLAAGIVAVALLFQLGRSLYGHRAGTLSAFILALSPLAILFSVTVFMDSLLTAFLLASLWTAARDRWGLSGLLFGLAFASKQTALFFLPLILAIGILKILRAKSNSTLREILRRVTGWLLPVALCAGLIFFWDVLRDAEIGFWTQGYVDNNPRRLIRAAELPTRFGEIVRLMHYSTGSTIVNVALLLGCFGLAIRAIRHRKINYRQATDLLLIGFIWWYLSIYLLFAFNLWDRYLVALVPILALLLARTILIIGAFISTNYSSRKRQLFRHPFQNEYTLLSAGIIILLLFPAIRASNSRYPIGGDHGAYDGIEKVAAFLNDLEEGDVLYDHWLSWELSFYLFDGPLYVAWMPGPAALATDLIAHGANSRRYIVSPGWESFSEFETAIAASGYETQVQLTTYDRDGRRSFSVYEIVPLQNS